MLVNTFLASLAAKVAMAAGLAVATVTAAGAAGVLPDPAQHAVASVVEATTPFTVPDRSTVVSSVTDQVKDTVGTVGGTTTNLAGDDDESDDDEGTGGTTDGTRTANHGACVSTVAKNTPGGPDKGKTVSSVARSDCGKTSSSSSTTLAPTSSTSSTSTTVVTSSSTSSTVATSGTSANRGPGNSGSNGNSGNSGNSGKGNSGKN